MKTITTNVSSHVYSAFQKHAKRAQRSTSELIREAMQHYLETKLDSRPSLKNMTAISLGEPLSKSLVSEDLFAEMINVD